MGSKEISLDEDAYECLRDIKPENKRYSDVVKRLTNEQSWMQVTGIWPDASNELSGYIKEGRHQ